jgi:alkanesulfonate monooxygenase SsuD/methylene tetrahydromethanopterin reductase-like flavin-dependent oxidoreductase (luciferase family)
VRLKRLGEAVRICKALFTSETPVTFKGDHYCVQDLDPLPRPVQTRLPVMVGGRQRNSLSLAAREADIVGISLLDQRAPGAPPPPSFEQKLAWVRSAAGDRFAELELHVNASVVAVTQQPADAVQAFAARTGQSVDDALASPATLVGSVEAIVEKLHRLREEFGVTYYVVHARNVDAFSPVLARL